jgi:rubrerythrin
VDLCVITIAGKAKDEKRKAKGEQRIAKEYRRISLNLPPSLIFENMYYSGLEIIEIAIRIEENGEEFYKAAAEMIKESPEVKGLFYDLAEKEITHIAIFQKLADKFEPESFEFSQEESADYIGHLADTHIFGRKDAGADLAKTVSTPKQALEIAFKFENDSVAFYEELMKRASGDSKALVARIIDEEKEHAAEIKRFM